MHQPLPKLKARFVRDAGFFRSSVASGIAGLVAGGSMIATAVDHANIDLRAALATLLTAAAVAATDYLTRMRHERRKHREHESKFEGEHAKTRAHLKTIEALLRREQTQNPPREG